MIGGKFASLTIMKNEDTDLDSMITTFNKAMTETASEMQKFLICATEGENCERKDLNLKNMRNTGK